MAFSANGRNAANINVTPLIDILLVLLVTFLLITPVTSTGEKTRIPSDSNQKPNHGEDEVVVLQLSVGPGSSVELAINHQKLEWSALGNRLEGIFKARADKTLFLSSDRDIDFSYIAQAADVAHAAGVENLALIPEPRD
jgi:biopolymer transport protein ExbD